MGLPLRGIVNTALAPLGLRMERIQSDVARRYGELCGIDPELLHNLDRETRKVINVLDYTKSNGTQYSAATYESAYHSIELDGTQFLGQRNPKERFNGVPFDFGNATVLDLGCNQGGMLFQISDQIQRGIGIDFDFRMINAANRIRSFKSANNLDFYVFDLEKEDFGILDDLMPSAGVDVIFLLSVCMWIRNWKEVILKCSHMSCRLLFETNGTRQQQDDQLSFLQRVYRTVDPVRASSQDDLLQKARALYFCHT